MMNTFQATTTLTPTDLERLHQVRFQTVGLPCAVDHRLRDSHLLCKESRAPVCRVRGDLLRSHADDLTLNFLVRTGTTSPRKVLLYTSEAMLAEAVSPTPHSVSLDPHLLSYIRIRVAISGKKDHSGSLSLPHRNSPTA